MSALGACAYDLDPYRSRGSEGGAATISSSIASAALTSSGSSGQITAATGQPIPTSTSSADGSSSSGADPGRPYPFCSEPDPLDDPGNWNDGNQVEFEGGHVQVGPDNAFSYVTWEDLLEIQAPCVFTVRLESNFGAASFGLRKNGANQLYMIIHDNLVEGPSGNSGIDGEFPMTLALVITSDSVVSAFRDVSGWHRVDSVGAPAWLGDGLRPVMTKSGDDLYAIFDAYNAAPVFPSDIEEPPLP